MHSALSCPLPLSLSRTHVILRFFLFLSIPLYWWIKLMPFYGCRPTTIVFVGLYSVYFVCMCFLCMCVWLYIFLPDWWIKIMIDNARDQDGVRTPQPVTLWATLSDIIIIIIIYLLKKTTYSNRKASEQDRQAQGALTSALMVQVQ